MSDEIKNIESSEDTEKVFGYLVEFDTPEELVQASKKVKESSYTKWEAFAPFPVHGLEKAVGIKRTLLPYFTFLCGITGLFLGVLMQWWMNAYDYKYMISGKPFFSLPAFIPVIFEMTILFSAFGAVIGMLFFNKMPKFHNSIFNSKRFLRATSDKFFICLEASDAEYDQDKTVEFLESLGGKHIERITDD